MKLIAAIAIAAFDAAFVLGVATATALVAGVIVSALVGGGAGTVAMGAGFIGAMVVMRK